MQTPQLKGRMTVVLDLDGTLISSFTPSRAPRLPPGMVSYVVGRGQKLNPGGVFVIERPGLHAFLTRLNEFAGLAMSPWCRLCRRAASVRLPELCQRLGPVHRGADQIHLS